jgi:nitrite reductase (NADH) large subunit
VLANTLKVVGIDLMAAGDIDAEGQLESFVSKDEEKKTYRKLVIKDNVLVGAILLGDLQGSNEIQQAIKMKKDISSLKQDLKSMGFDISRL